MNTKAPITFLYLLFYFALPTLAQNNVIDIESQRNQDKSISFNFKKNAPGTYHVELWFTRLENANSSGYRGEVIHSSGKLFYLKPRNTNNQIDYAYKYWYIRGKLQPKIDTNFIYLLPLSTTNSSKIRSLSNLDKKYFGAKQPKNWHAYQFMANPGDTVFAARKGLVVEIVNKHSYNTNLSVAYQSTANSVTIEHPDGTLSEYSGFKKGNIWVKEGETIYPRTPIGSLAQYDIEKNAQLRFLVYYLNFIPKSKEEPQNLKSKVQCYAYIEPKFLTESGVEFLQAEKSYKTMVDYNIVTKEFTKKEKRKMEKEK